ncbi:MAG TPA: hypothetical protein VK137_09415, partial [Planctomycetaceae bacterium]|nr:hypothetical protein [Planctomycetaceae bacterium]
MPSTRRDFIEQTTGAAATWLYVSAAHAADTPKSDADRLPVAVIGPGGMGMHHTNQLASNQGVRAAYVCDVDEQRAARAAEAVTNGSGQTPKVVKDMRHVLDDP